MNTGAYSSTFTTNEGNIGLINNKGSYISIDNTGTIDRIKNGKTSECVIGYSKTGKIGKVTGGRIARQNKWQTNIRRCLNRTQFSLEIKVKGIAVDTVILVDTIKGKENGKYYLNQFVISLKDQLKQSCTRHPESESTIYMYNGQTLSEWYNSYMSADNLTKADMFGDLISEGITIAGTTLAGEELIKCIKSGRLMTKLKGASKTYSNIAKQATKNADSAEVVLGKFNQGGVSYVDVAKERGATYFQLDDWNGVVNQVGEKNIWNVNETFIRQQANANKTFILSHDPSKATGYFAQEVNLLDDMGYSFTKVGSVWKAVK